MRAREMQPGMVVCIYLFLLLLLEDLMTMLSIMILISAHIRAVHYPSPRIHLPSHIRFSTCRLISSSSSSAAAAAHTHTHIHREGCGGILHFKMAAIPPSTSSLLATCDRKARRIIHDLRASLSSLESISSSSTTSCTSSKASHSKPKMSFGSVG